MSLRILHNPQCSKSRATLALLRDNGVEPDIVDYRSDPPSADEIRRIAALLGVRPVELVREADARKAGLEARLRAASDDEACRILSENPALIERPIVIRDDSRAAIGRPPENVLSLL